MYNACVKQVRTNSRKPQCRVSSSGIRKATNHRFTSDLGSVTSFPLPLTLLSSGMMYSIRCRPCRMPRWYFWYSDLETLHYL